MYFFNPRTLKAEDEWSVSSRSAWATQWVSNKPGQLVEILSQTTTKSVCVGGGGSKLEIYIIETPKL